jgi:hypothetical protein
MPDAAEADASVEDNDDDGGGGGALELIPPPSPATCGFGPHLLGRDASAARAGAGAELGRADWKLVVLTEALLAALLQPTSPAPGAVEGSATAMGAGATVVSPFLLSAGGSRVFVDAAQAVHDRGRSKHARYC